MCIFAICIIACNSADVSTDPPRNQEAIRKLCLWWRFTFPRRQLWTYLKELKSDKFHKMVEIFKYVDPNNRTVFFLRLSNWCRIVIDVWRLCSAPIHSVPLGPISIINCDLQESPSPSDLINVIASNAAGYCDWNQTVLITIFRLASQGTWFK